MQETADTEYVILLKVSLHRFFVNFAVVSSIIECPVSRFW